MTVVPSLIYFAKLMELLESSPELKKTSVGILKAVGWTAGGTAFGGAVGGPGGAFMGGVVGSTVAYCLSNSYQSLIDVLNNLSDAEKSKLEIKVQQLVGSVGIEQLVTFISTEVNRALLIELLQDNTALKAGG